jgi:hypothetical protein
MWGFKAACLLVPLYVVGRAALHHVRMRRWQRDLKVWEVEMALVSSEAAALAQEGRKEEARALMFDQVSKLSALQPRGPV